MQESVDAICRRETTHRVNEFAASLFHEDSLAPAAILSFEPSPGKDSLRELKGNEKTRYLAKAIQSAPHHPSRFWRGDEREIQRHNQKVDNLVGIDARGSKRGMLALNLPK